MTSDAQRVRADEPAVGEEIRALVFRPTPQRPSLPGTVFADRILRVGGAVSGKNGTGVSAELASDRAWRLGERAGGVDGGQVAPQKSLKQAAEFDWINGFRLRAAVGLPAAASTTNPRL